MNGATFASDLRARFGAPLAREMFVTPVGEMVVNYAADGNVCRIELPPIGRDAKRAGVWHLTRELDCSLDLRLLP